jgi:hypothetical protein
MSYTQHYENMVHTAAGTDPMHALQFSAAYASGQTFVAGSVVSLNSAGALEAGCTGTRVPLYAINGVADLDVTSETAIFSGGNVNCFVGVAGVELFTSAYDSASANDYDPNTLLWAATGSNAGKLTEAPVTGYNDASILGSVSRGLKTEAYAQTRLYFWPWFMPPVSVSA